MRRQASPAVAAVLAEPQAAGGGAHGQAVAVVVHRQAVAIDQVVGRRLRQAGIEGFEGLAAVAGAGDDEAAVHRHAAFVLHRGDEPGGIRPGRVHGDGETEARRLRTNVMPLQAAIAGGEDAVVVLHPQHVGLRGAMHQAVRVLDRRFLAQFRRHVVGTHPFRRAAPVGAAVAGLPDAAAGHSDGDVPAVARIDAHRVDARPVVAAAEPAGALGAVP
ncbi:hypothetical protein D3C81_1422740 [compost metagenome]